MIPTATRRPPRVSSAIWWSTSPSLSPQPPLKYRFHPCGRARAIPQRCERVDRPSSRSAVARWRRATNGRCAGTAGSGRRVDARGAPMTAVRKRRMSARRASPSAGCPRCCAPARPRGCSTTGSSATAAPGLAPSGPPPHVGPVEVADHQHRLDHAGRAHGRAGVAAAPVPPAARGRGRRTLGGHEPDPLAVAQPGRGGRDRRLPRRDYWRAVSARRGPRLPARGVRALRGADGGTGEPTRRGRRDHPPALDRGRGHPSRAPLAAPRGQHPAPAAPAAPAPDSRRLAGAHGDRAGGPHRRRLDGGPGANGGRVCGASRRFRRRPGGGGPAAQPARLPLARGGVRAGRGDRDSPGRPVPPHEVRGVPGLGDSRHHSRTESSSNSRRSNSAREGNKIRNSKPGKEASAGCREKTTAL